LSAELTKNALLQTVFLSILPNGDGRLEDSWSEKALIKLTNY